MASTAERLRSAFVWEPEAGVTSEEGFEEYHDEVSIANFVDDHLPDPWLLPVVFPLGYYAVWTLVARYYGRLSEFLAQTYPKAFTLGFVIVLATLLWFDRRGREVVLEIRDSFDATDREYYSFMGRFVERLYEPFPWTRTPERRRVHRPTVCAGGCGLLAFLALLVLAPTVLASFVGHEWRGLPLGLQVLYAVSLAIVGVAATYNLWVDVVAGIYLGSRIARFDVRLDVTRIDTHLGLRTYSEFVFWGLVAYLAELTVSGFFVVRQRNLYVLLAYLGLTMLAIVGGAVAHYGLFKAIKSSKEAQLQRLKRRYGPEMETWFGTGYVGGHAASEESLRAFLLAKREIERIPDWPFDVNRLAELLVLVVASNLSVAFRLLLA